MVSIPKVALPCQEAFDERAARDQSSIGQE